MAHNPRQHAVRAPLGTVIVDGQASAIRVTSISASMSATVLRDIAGCEVQPWYNIVTEAPWSGSFSTRERNPLLEQVLLGGTRIAGGTAGAPGTGGIKLVQEKDLAVEATDKIVLSSTMANMTDEDGMYIISVYHHDASGRTMLKQTTGTIATGEFDVSGTDVTFFGGEYANGQLMDVVYATANAAGDGDNYKLISTSVPGYVSLLLPLCGPDLSTGTDEYHGRYFPRVRCTGVEDSSESGGGSLSGVTYSWEAVQDGNGLTMQYV